MALELGLAYQLTHVINYVHVQFSNATYIGNSYVYTHVTVFWKTDHIDTNTKIHFCL